MLSCLRSRRHPSLILTLISSFSRGISAGGIGYAALGDSYAAAIGTADTRAYGAVCYQSNYSYIAQLGKVDNVTIDTTRFFNRACAGLGLYETAKCEILGNVTADPQNDYYCRDLSTSNGIGNPDLVTVSIGAESIEYFRLISNCIYFPWIGGCSEVNKSAESALATLAAPNGKAFEAFFDKYLKRESGLLQSSGRIKVIGYPAPFNIDMGSDSYCPTFAGGNVTLDQRKQINSVVGRLNDQLKAQSKAVGVTYLDTNPLFDGHRFCDNDQTSEWLINPIPNFNLSNITAYKSAHDVVQQFGDITQYPDTRIPGGSYLFGAFHPTAEGHRAIAQLLSQNMK